ncbi:sugar O-acetyltransferase [Desemzia sp. RIT804]|uniref:sugar O-acetyltransferase n=1 Tax=Desemzia sp. RIT 804 TaxID=2810209 RepID=UPI00194DED47|nr:sugar O-acetyltransferase [Desemzia sp. RIT 804]
MRTQKERMLAGDLYIANDPELREMNKKNRRLMYEFNHSKFDEKEKRTEIIKELLGKTGENVYFEPPFRCDYGSHITVGENFYANFDCIMLDVAPITIGKNVMFGPRVGVYTAGHPIDHEVRISGLEFGTSVTIGDNVWVGANAVINPGVTIGDNVIIGSGSIVTKDIPSNVVAVGNPCRVLREVDESDKVYWNSLKEAYEKEMIECHTV